MSSSIVQARIKGTPAAIQALRANVKYQACFEAFAVQTPCEPPTKPWPFPTQPKPTCPPSTP